MDHSDTTSSLPSPSASMLSLSLDEQVERDEFFYFEIMVFKAGNKLFRVPRYGLPADGGTFSNLFSREVGGPGSSDANPICLDADVSAFDFRSLLKATYPPPGTIDVNLTFDEWQSVLKLAKKWSLLNMRDKAIKQTNEQVEKKSAVEKVLLAKKYGVVKWLKEGYRALVSQDVAISDEDKTKLGLDTYARLMAIRERSFLDSAQLFSNTSCYCQYCGNNHPCSNRFTRQKFGFDDAVGEVFGDEVKES